MNDENKTDESRDKTEEKAAMEGAEASADREGSAADPDEATDAERESAEERADEEAAEGDKAPPIDFTTFIFSLSTQAMVHMGEMTLPGMPEASVNLIAAKQTIDIVSLLEEKTKGNLTESEARLLSNLLYDLRMRYLHAIKKKPKSDESP